MQKYAKMLRNAFIFGESYCFILWNKNKGDLHPMYVKARDMNIPLTMLDEAGNPVIDLDGKPLIAHAIETALKSNIGPVFVSTDKAVRPTNVMGVTKRIAELSLQALNYKNLNLSEGSKQTKFSIVRFGNVLDSSGSVIPKFREQIKNGGPITLTHKDITRYFMTITEAAQLVIQAGAMAKGGDVFVLDMGNPIKIYDLAIRMIELSGLTAKLLPSSKGDIEIKITGLRPGEKLFEELLLSNNPIKTKHPKIFRSKEPFILHEQLIKEIDLLKKLMINNDLENILKKLTSIVVDYSPNSEILDHTFIKKQ